MDKKGSAIFVLGIPPHWPSKKKEVLISYKKDKTKVCVEGDVNGSIVVTIGSLNFVSQKIQFINTHGVILGVFWDIEKSNDLAVYINKDKLNSIDIHETLSITGNYKPINKEETLPQKEILKACKKWMQWRDHHYGKIKDNPKKNRELKPLIEQRNELEASIRSLCFILNNHSSNKTMLTINALPLLRSLLFWSDGKGPYNPLLFRLAAKCKLPLPIFALESIIPETKTHPLFKDAYSQKVYNYPSIKKKLRDEKLMDFQEWLNLEFTRNSKKETFRWKDLIFDCANTMSATHFDEDKPIYLKEISETITWNKSDLVNYIVAITEVTIDVANNVLRSIDKEINSNV